MISLTDKENKSYEKQKVCCICTQKISTNYDDDNKKCHKVRDHCHYTGTFRGDAHSTCRFKIKHQKKYP